MVLKSAYECYLKTLIVLCFGHCVSIEPPCGRFIHSSVQPSIRLSFRYQCENFHLQFPQSETKKEPSRASSLIQKGQLLWQTIIFPIISRNKDFFLTTKFSRVISIISAGMTRGVGNTEIVVEIAEINRQKVCVLKHAKLFLRFMENSWNSKDRRFCVKNLFKHFLHFFFSYLSV